MRKTMMLLVTGIPTLAMGEEVTIAALGDSLTQGFGLVQEDGFVPQLQAWLDERGIKARVINAGVSGDTTAGGLARVGWTLTPDVDGMIVTLGGNDMLRGIDPGISRANVHGILEAAAEAEVEVLLVGMQAPGNFGPEYKMQFDALYPELAEEFGVLLAPDFFAGLDADSDPSVIRAYMQADGIHPSAEGVVRIVDGLGPDVASLVERIQTQ